jgi:hypothetical protein
VSKDKKSFLASPLRDIEGLGLGEAKLHKGKNTKEQLNSVLAHLNKRDKGEEKKRKREKKRKKKKQDENLHENTKHETHNVQHATCSMQHTTHNTQHATHSSMQS